MNEKQRTAFEKMKAGQTIFLTGEAGTGKSYTLKKFIEWAKAMKKSIGITAPTGTAAVTIGGRTIHSFLGIGLGKKPAMDLALYTKKKNPTTVRRLKELEYLIIDEISMVSAEFFEKISDYLIYIRGGKSPFGGVKLILCGDMAQLPPIDGGYCFTSSLWNIMKIETTELTEVVRQISDSELREILNEVRWGECSETTFQKLRALRYPNFGEVEPTILYSKNIDVDSININAYNKLSGSEREYVTSYSEKPYTKIWAESLKIPESIKLKLGAQVILTYNLSTEEGLVNGTRGVVTELAEDGPVILFKNGDQVLIENIMIEDDNEKDVWINYCPIRLAWAITIHKSQSMTISAAELDLGSSIFEYGQAYTALSRIQDSKSVKIKNIKKTSFKTHPDVLQFYNRMPKSVCTGCGKDFYWSEESSHNSCISS